MTDTAKAAKAARDAHEKRVSSYLAQILQVFSTLGLDAARVAELVGYDGGGGAAFSFKDYPAARGAVERMFATMRANMEAAIMRSTAAEWAKSNEAQDLIADGVLAARKVSRADGKHEHLYRRNGDQLKAFQARKINGMSLSRRVWDLSEGHKAGLEAAISTAVEKGMSAVVLSKKVSQYLNDFPKLRADYKQRYGKAADIRDCQYESARLARTEINMAYRAAESLRWRQMDFVVGMEVKLSGSHPAHDICDTLKGKYPKDFEWIGWHPSCICYKVPILSTEDEFFALDGDGPSVNAVSDVPNAFKEWVAGNRERIAAAEKRGTLPYFVRDNKARVDKILKGKRVKSEAEKEAIRKAWEERGKKNAEALQKAGYVLKHAAEYPDVDTKTLAAHISAGRAAQAAREAKEVAKAIAAAHKDEVAPSAIIPDVHQWRKKFSSAELHAVYDAVEKKLQQWSALPLEGQAGKLKFEMQWVAKHKKYGTWEVARAAYGKRLAAVEDALEWQGIDAALADAKAFKTASKPYKELVAKLSAAAGAKDKAAAKSLVGEVAAKREALEKARMKTTVPKLEELSSARIKELLDEYANVSVKSMDKALRPSTEKTWATLTEQERLVLTKYTQTYSYLNEPLRGLKYTGERPKSEFDSDLPILTRALSKFTAPRDMVVRRGTGDFMIKTLGCNLSDVKVGDVFVDKGFLSTGAHRTKGFHKGIELVICVPKGAQGAFAEPFSHYTDENKFSFGGGGYKKNLWNGTSVETIKGEFEWIGQRGCEFRVVKKQGKRIFLSLIGQLK